MALDTITIVDAKSGTRAKIMPDLGFNCYAFNVLSGEGHLEALWAAPDFTDGTAKPSSSGIPLLFPFAGRIAGASFQFDGKTYQLEAGDGLGNAIHGFVINRRWRVIKHEPDRLVGQFQASIDDVEILKHWPTDFRITADYQVQAGRLIGEYLVENPSQKPLPFGFGTHPYFRLPLGGKSAEDCVVTVPVSTDWELKELLPTGKTSAPPVVAQLTQGMPVRDMRLDNVFGGLKFENHRCDTSVHDPHSGHRVVQSFDDQFTACVIYNPPHRQAVCIEPYTTIPDAFALREKDVDPHLQILAPGQSFRTRIEIRIL